MTRWAPQKADTLAALAAEITALYPSGRVAVFGAGAVEFAAELGIPALAPTEPLTLATAGEYNYTIWLDDGSSTDRVARTTASAIVDVTDPEHPRRVFADSC